MKKTKLLILLLLGFLTTQAQLNTEELSLTISKAEDANLQKLKSYLWKRKSEAYMDGQLKATTWTEFSFDATGKVQAKVIDAETSVKQKPGLRGNAQKSAIEAKMDYVEKALGLSVQYAYMTKGQLLDFFSKATVSKKDDGTLVAVADNVYVQGDKLTVHVDPKTNLFKYKEFKSLLGKDPIDGVINYESFSSGVSHVSATVMNMPAQKMKINATNQDYSQRVN
ncbi:MAG: hypothetical protein ABL895_16185 [Cyclobacteriaceae bacterium]